MKRKDIYFWLTSSSLILSESRTERPKAFKTYVKQKSISPWEYTPTKIFYRLLLNDLRSRREIQDKNHIYADK